jgi:hypothetical protein
MYTAKEGSANTGLSAGVFLMQSQQQLKTI